MPAVIEREREAEEPAWRLYAQALAIVLPGTVLGTAWGLIERLHDWI